MQKKYSRYEEDIHYLAQRQRALDDFDRIFIGIIGGGGMIAVIGFFIYASIPVFFH